MRAGTYEAADYSDFTCQCIDRLIIRQEDDDVGTAFGEGDNTYIIEENFLFYGKSEDDLKEISANILDKIEWLNYRPFTATVRGNFCFEAGDSIRLVTRYELIESYALQITFNGIQALRGSFVADGVETYTNDLNSMNSTVVQLKGKTSSLSKAISTKVEKDDIISTINQSAEEIKINANKINFEGSIVLKGYVTVESLTENGTTVIDGSRITTGTIEGVDFKSIDEETKYVDISKGRISGGVNDTECGYIVFGDKHTDSVDSTQHNSLLLNSDFLALSVNGVCVAGSKDSTDFTQCPKELEVKYVKAVNFTNSSVTYGTLKFINGLLVNSE
jgi:hypothetical protein